MVGFGECDDFHWSTWRRFATDADATNLAPTSGHDFSIALRALVHAAYSPNFCFARSVDALRKVHVRRSTVLPDTAYFSLHIDATVWIPLDATLQYVLCRLEIWGEKAPVELVSVVVVLECRESATAMDASKGLQGAFLLLSPTSVEEFPIIKGLPNGVVPPVENAANARHARTTAWVQLAFEDIFLISDFVLDVDSTALKDATSDPSGEELTGSFACEPVIVRLFDPARFDAASIPKTRRHFDREMPTGTNNTSVGIIAPIVDLVHVDASVVVIHATP